MLDVCLCIQSYKVTNHFSLRSTHVNIYRCILWGFSISPGRIPLVFFLMTTHLIARIVGDHERGEGDGGEISLLGIWAFSSSPVFYTAFSFSSANISGKFKSPVFYLNVGETLTLLCRAEKEPLLCMFCRSHI